MARESMYRSFTLRLRKNDKKEAAIIRILDSLDPEVAKSKNKLIIEAIEFYVAHYGEDELTLQASDDNRYVTRKELQESLDEMKVFIQELNSNCQKDVYENIVYSMFGRLIPNGTMPVMETEKTDSNEEVDESVMDDVMKWS
ncbi:hypothetical protein E5357_17100 [Hominisplanchenecus murintestinalis]|uniref:Uncharacterized protein n=1 Tax=Hominisplanchenecus murintestinalis TaxID=2941517 RepID=A0AC61QUX9_9FIRM|nr:hypothetical protein [Hominisplanchenecus murintestinalis]TGX96167.1 hypothetical protein E5357_17100 [Hominisplanchenecus murintestinalis]